MKKLKYSLTVIWLVINWNVLMGQLQLEEIDASKIKITISGDAPKTTIIFKKDVDHGDFKSTDAGKSILSVLDRVKSNPNSKPFEVYLANNISPIIPRNFVTLQLVNDNGTEYLVLDGETISLTTTKKNSFEVYTLKNDATDKTKVDDFIKKQIKLPSNIEYDKVKESVNGWKFNNVKASFDQEHYRYIRDQKTVEVLRNLPLRNSILNLLVTKLNKNKAEGLDVNYLYNKKFFPAKENAAFLSLNLDFKEWVETLDNEINQLKNPNPGPTPINKWYNHPLFNVLLGLVLGIITIAVVLFFWPNIIHQLFGRQDFSRYKNDISDIIPRINLIDEVGDKDQVEQFNAIQSDICDNQKDKVDLQKRLFSLLKSNKLEKYLPESETTTEDELEKIKIIFKERGHEVEIDDQSFDTTVTNILSEFDILRDDWAKIEQKFLTKDVNQICLVADQYNTILQILDLTLEDPEKGAKELLNKINTGKETQEKLELALSQHQKLDEDFKSLKIKYDNFIFPIKRALLITHSNEEKIKKDALLKIEGFQNEEYKIQSLLKQFNIPKKKKGVDSPAILISEFLDNINRENIALLSFKNQILSIYKEKEPKKFIRSLNRFIESEKPKLTNNLNHKFEEEIWVKTEAFNKVLDHYNKEFGLKKNPKKFATNKYDELVRNTTGAISQSLQIEKVAKTSDLDLRIRQVLTIILGDKNVMSRLDRLFNSDTQVKALENIAHKTKTLTQRELILEILKEINGIIPSNKSIAYNENMFRKADQLNGIIRIFEENGKKELKDQQSLNNVIESLRFYAKNKSPMDDYFQKGKEGSFSLSEFKEEENFNSRLKKLNEFLKIHDAEQLFSNDFRRHFIFYRVTKDLVENITKTPEEFFKKFESVVQKKYPKEPAYQEDYNKLIVPLMFLKKQEFSMDEVQRFIKKLYVDKIRIFKEYTLNDVKHTYLKDLEDRTYFLKFFLEVGLLTYDFVLSQMEADRRETVRNLLGINYYMTKGGKYQLFSNSLSKDPRLCFNIVGLARQIGIKDIDVLVEGCLIPKDFLEPN